MAYSVPLLHTYRLVERQSRLAAWLLHKSYIPLSAYLVVVFYFNTNHFEDVLLFTLA
jgi:hypothetical protein